MTDSTPALLSAETARQIFPDSGERDFEKTDEQEAARWTATPQPDAVLAIATVRGTLRLSESAGRVQAERHSRQRWAWTATLGAR